jgi:hypothetical protein
MSSLGRTALVARLASRRYDADHADVAQLVEHLHGKEGVSGSSPDVGLRMEPVPPS